MKYYTTNNKEAIVWTEDDLTIIWIEHNVIEHNHKAEIEPYFHDFQVHDLPKNWTYSLVW